MLLAIPSMAQLCVSLLLDRARDFSRADLQAERLVARASWPPICLTNAPGKSLSPSERLLAFRQ